MWQSGRLKAENVLETLSTLEKNHRTGVKRRFFPKQDTPFPLRVVFSGKIMSG
jgi:hypothetical protein